MIRCSWTLAQVLRSVHIKDDNYKENYILAFNHAIMLPTSYTKGDKE